MSLHLKGNKVQPLATVRWKAEGAISYRASSLTSHLGKGIYLSQSSEEHQTGQLPTLCWRCSPQWPQKQPLVSLAVIFGCGVLLSV